MIRPSLDAKVYLYTGRVDMRKSIDGLAALVQEGMLLNPMEPIIFVFCNRARDKIKCLYWERNGFVLFYKRLEKDRFKWLSTRDSLTQVINGQSLNWLLDGFDIFNNKPHQSLYFKSVC